MKNFNINKIIRPHLLSLKTYDAVNPPDLLSKKSGIPENELIKLNGNENPYGASPKAIAALKNLPMHLYPDPDQIKIRNAITISCYWKSISIKPKSRHGTQLTG